MRSITKYIVLVGSNALYACEAICTKYASMHDFMSVHYILGIVGSIFILGIYAIVWQQILKRINLTDAYMFRGTSLIFVMLFSVLFFHEGFRLSNIIGIMIILTGTVLYADADKRANK